MTDAGVIVLRSVLDVEDVRVYDVAGREVAFVPVLNGIVEVQVPAGVYVVSAGYGTRPVKVVVR